MTNDVHDDPESLARAIANAGTPVNLIGLYGGDAVWVVPVRKRLTTFQRTNLIASGIYDKSYSSALKTALQCKWTEVKKPKPCKAQMNQYGNKWSPWIVWKALSKCNERTASIEELSGLLSDIRHKTIVQSASKLVCLGLADRVGRGIYKAGLIEPQIHGKYGEGRESVQSRILALLAKNGSCTAVEAGAYLHLNRANARIHLIRMVANKKLVMVANKRPQTWKVRNG